MSNDSNLLANGGKGTAHYGEPREFAWYKYWAADVPLYRMWFEFLACSPTYELARRDLAKELSEEERSNLPDDFGTVISCYKDLGDLRKISFWHWWSKKAETYLGIGYAWPYVKHLGLAYDYNKERGEKRSGQDEHLYAEADLARKTSQILVFSTALKRKDVLQRIKKELDKLEFDQTSSEVSKPAYPMIKIGKRRSALQKYLLTLKFRARYPGEELWSIGVRASLTAAAKTWPFDNGTPRKLGDKDCIAMSIATSRALLRARMISEHAARGVFPSHAQFEEAKKYVPDDLSRRVQEIDTMFANEVLRDEVADQNLQKLFVEYGIV